MSSGKYHCYHIASCDHRYSVLILLSRASTALIVWTTQAGKLLYYLSFPSGTIFAIIFMILTSVLPFIRQLTEFWSRDDSELYMETDLYTSSSTDAPAPTINYVALATSEIALYVLFQSLVSFYAGPRVAAVVLSTALGKVSPRLHVSACCSPLMISIRLPLPCKLFSSRLPFGAYS